MSKYMVLTPKQILEQNSLEIKDGASEADLNKIAAQLELKNPALAAKFRAIDFGAIKTYLIKTVLQKIAADNNCKYKERETYSDNGFDSIKNKVDVSGCLCDENGKQIIFYITKSGKISAYSDSKSAFSKLVSDFEKVYREDAMTAALKIIAPAVGITGDVKKSEKGGQTTLTIG